MDSVRGTGALPPVGFPIRKSPDQSLLGSSPRLIAAINVLHRLLVPRHSPCALVLLIHDSPSFENTTSTAVQFSRYRRDASRASAQPASAVRPPSASRGGAGLSKLNSMRPATLAGGLSSPCRYRFQACLTADHGAEAPEPCPRRTRRLAGTPAVINGHRIPRKEVIQPQLPLRLPCYDFTPVTNSTFDRSLPCGLGHGLRVSPASVV